MLLVLWGDFLLVVSVTYKGENVIFWGQRMIILGWMTLTVLHYFSHNHLLKVARGRGVLWYMKEFIYILWCPVCVIPWGCGRVMTVKKKRSGQGYSRVLCGWCRVFGLSSAFARARKKLFRWEWVWQWLANILWWVDSPGCYLMCTR